MKFNFLYVTYFHTTKITTGKESFVGSHLSYIINLIKSLQADKFSPELKN